MPTRDLLAEITVADDHAGPSRDALQHSRDKLAILAYYIPGFAVACKDRSPVFFFVDGLAGSGLYHFKEDDTFALGSTLIALRMAHPAFHKTVSMEKSRTFATALKARTAEFDHAVVRQGDCNSNLLPLVEREIPATLRSSPVLFLLDPAGFELAWETVAACSRFRVHPKGWKAELLILVPTGSVGRAPGGRVDIEEVPESKRVDAAFPPRANWADVVQRRRRGEISASESRRLLAEEYESGLKALGYKHVLTREISRPGWDVDEEGMGVYHLAFATDNDAGKKIMESAFARVRVNKPRRLQRLEQLGQRHFLDLVEPEQP